MDRVSFVCLEGSNDDLLNLIAKVVDANYMLCVN